LHLEHVFLSIRICGIFVSFKFYSFFKIYYGYPNDKFLKNKDNEQKRNYVIQIDSLEAGSDAYQKRNKNYENLES